MLADRGGGGSVARAWEEYLCSWLGYFVKMAQLNGLELINSNINSFIRQKALSTFDEDEKEIWGNMEQGVETSSCKLHYADTAVEMKLDCALSNNLDRGFQWCSWRIVLNNSHQSCFRVFRFPDCCTLNGVYFIDVLQILYPHQSVGHVKNPLVWSKKNKIRYSRFRSRKNTAFAMSFCQSLFIADRKPISKSSFT